MKKSRVLILLGVLAVAVIAIVALHQVDPMGLIRRLHGMA